MGNGSSQSSTVLYVVPTMRDAHVPSAVCGPHDERCTWLAWARKHMPWMKTCCGCWGRGFVPEISALCFEATGLWTCGHSRLGQGWWDTLPPPSCRYSCLAGHDVCVRYICLASRGRTRSWSGQGGSWMSGCEAFRGVSCFGKLGSTVAAGGGGEASGKFAGGCWPCGTEGQQGGLGWRKRTQNWL